MPKKNWFLNSQGQTSGPLPQSKVVLMLEQNELHFTDFAWTQGYSTWTRISDIPDFASLMPDAPEAPLPGEEAVETPAPPKSVPPTSAPRAAAALAESAEAPPVFETKKKPDLKVVPAAKPAPEVRPAAAATPKTWVARYERVKLEGTVTVNGKDRYPIINISESGILMHLGEHVEVGAEVKFRIESKNLEKALDMTGIVIRELDATPKSIAIEFTRVNPAHRRLIKEYVTLKLAAK